MELEEVSRASEKEKKSGKIGANNVDPAPYDWILSGLFTFLYLHEMVCTTQVQLCMSHVFSEF
jgi:hypothetical protein